VDGSHVPDDVDIGECVGLQAGWASDDELVWVNWRRADPEDWDSPLEEVVATVTTVGGELVDTVTLEPAPPARIIHPNGQWGAVAQSGGPDLLVIDRDDDRDDREYTVHRFSLADGYPTAQPVTVSDMGTPCGVDWAGNQISVPTFRSDASNASTAFLDEGGYHPAVVVDPVVKSKCFIWAADALAGDARGGLFGLSTWWSTWWWREALGGLALLTAGIAAWRWRQHRRYG
jgi:hypothetical protein